MTARSKTSGLSGAQLRRPLAAERPKSLVGALTEARTESTEGSFGGRLTLSAIAGHPLNPRADLGDLRGLAASMKSLGVLQPVLVIPRNQFAEAHPALLDQIPAEATHVLHAGHRRLAAARLAGLTSIPAIELEDSADDAVATFFAENYHRADLSPLEEARTFGLLAETGLSQRAIAQKLGIASQSHISKRLALLALPQEAQDALEAGELQIQHALTLAAVSPELQPRVWTHMVQRDQLHLPEASIRVVQNEAEREQAESEGQKQAAAEGIAWMSPAQREAQGIGWGQRLTGKREITAAKKAGNLIASLGVAGTQTEYFTTAHTQSSETARPSGASTEDGERRRAGQAREELVLTLLRGKKLPPAKDVAQWVAIGLLHHDGGADALKRAWRWIGPVTSPIVEDAYAWRQQIEVHADQQTQLWVAFAIAIASIEGDVRAPYGDWQPRHRRYLEWLQGHGYELQPIEQRQLAKSAD